jgi:hypothetical protein
MRRAQLQTLEPIVIVIILTLIVSIGLLFYFRASSDITTRDQLQVGALQDLETLSALSRMPELVCTADVTRNTNCIDTEKAKAFAQLLRSDRGRNDYYPLLGSTSITITWIDLSSGESQLLLYNATDLNRSSVTPTRTYFTMYDPLTRTKEFAVMDILRGS